MAWIFEFVEITANEALLGAVPNLPVGLAVFGDDQVQQANLSVDVSDGTLLEITDVRVQNAQGTIGAVIYGPKQWLTMDIAAKKVVTETHQVDVLIHYTTDAGAKATEVVKVLVEPYKRDTARVDLDANLPDPTVLQAVGVGTVCYGDPSGVAYGYPAE